MASKVQKLRRKSSTYSILPALKHIDHSESKRLSDDNFNSIKMRDISSARRSQRSSSGNTNTLSAQLKRLKELEDCDQRFDKERFKRKFEKKKKSVLVINSHKELEEHKSNPMSLSESFRMHNSHQGIDTSPRKMVNESPTHQKSINLMVPIVNARLSGIKTRPEIHDKNMDFISEMNDPIDKEDNDREIKSMTAISPTMRTIKSFKIIEPNGVVSSYKRIRTNSNEEENPNSFHYENNEEDNDFERHGIKGSKFISTMDLASSNLENNLFKKQKTIKLSHIYGNKKLILYPDDGFRRSWDILIILYHHFQLDCFFMSLLHFPLKLLLLKIKMK